MGAAPVVKLSIEEYLAADRVSELPSEYHDGELFPISAVSWEHGLIVANLSRRIAERPEGGSCHIAAQVRIGVGPTAFVFPDQVVVCGKPEFTDEEKDTITNPKVIVEVLSPSTADYNYGGKFALYRRLPSLEEYVLIAQDRPNVDVFLKTPDGRWLLTPYEGWQAVVKLDSLGLALPLAELYAGVEFKQ
jgi:Uma2 family endonuclease